jgi:hypothetical protein
MPIERHCEEKVQHEAAQRYDADDVRKFHMLLIYLAQEYSSRRFKSFGYRSVCASSPHTKSK